MPSEVASLADDEAVLFDGPEARRYTGLSPDREHRVGSVLVRTLARPPGARLATVATVNDVHFGETRCGYVAGHELGPVLEVEPDQIPYPLTMNTAAVQEILALDPAAAVVVKGDLTAAGTRQEYDQFHRVYFGAFGSRLVATRGNHDNPAVDSGLPAPPPCQGVALDGVTLAVLDTSRPGQVAGEVEVEQAEWLDELAARADQPVMVFGHHPPAIEDRRLETVFGAGALASSGLTPASLARLVAVVQRRPALVGYFAGHTHRNKRRHLAPTGEFPWVEVASVKDFPGSWAEYRVFEGGILQIHRRVSGPPEAVEWSERCRSLYAGFYPDYAWGALRDRCFQIPLRESEG